MNYSFDFYDRLEKPKLILKKMDGTQVSDIANFAGLNVNIRYNDVSEMSFILHKSENESVYDLIKGKKYIETDIYGEFIIDDVVEPNNGLIKYKEVRCKSVDFELSYKRITLEPKVYKLYDLFSPKDTLMERILTLAPSWSIGSIDTSVGNLFRYFDVEDVDLLSFMYGDAEEAYQCIFEFDYFTRQINIKAIENVGYDTNIYLSLDNLINNIEIQEHSNEIVTNLRVFGGNDLDIRRVNPTGTDSLVNLTRFKDLEYISDDLIAKLDSYDAIYLSKKSDYENYLLTYRILNEELNILQGELGVLQNELSAIVTIRIEKMAAGLDISQEYTDYQNKKSEIDSKENQINNKQTQINSYVDLLNGIIDDLALENNFTESEIKTLDKALIEYTYQNEAYMITDSMTENDILDQAQQLYEDGQKILERLSQSRFSFRIDCADFLKNISYEQFIQQFGLTALMTIELEEDSIVETRLISYDYDWDSNSLSLEFTSKYRTNDTTYTYQELFKKSFNAGISVSFSKFKYKDWSANNKDAVTTFITSSLDASKNAVINAENQSVVFDKNGIICTTVDEFGNISDEQLHIVNNSLVFTDDSWQTAKLALGKIFDNRYGELYGIVGEVIVGKIIAGNNLLIENSNNKFTVDENGATLIDATMDITTSDNNGRIIADPTQGIKLLGNINGTFQENISIGNDGRIKARNIDILENANINGTLQSVDGIFTGTLQGVDGEFTGDITVTHTDGSISTLNSQGLKVQHTSGDFSLFNSEGFFRYVDGTPLEYISAISANTVTSASVGWSGGGSSTTKFTIQLRGNRWVGFADDVEVQISKNKFRPWLASDSQWQIGYITQSLFRIISRTNVQDGIDIVVEASDLLDVSPSFSRDWVRVDFSYLAILNRGAND